jgi:hypothetical protein
LVDEGASKISRGGSGYVAPAHSDMTIPSFPQPLAQGYVVGARPSVASPQRYPSRPLLRQAHPSVSMLACRLLIVYIAVGRQAKGHTRLPHCRLVWLIGDIFLYLLLPISSARIPDRCCRDCYESVSFDKFFCSAVSSVRVVCRQWRSRRQSRAETPVVKR